MEKLGQDQQEYYQWAENVVRAVFHHFWYSNAGYLGPYHLLGRYPYGPRIRGEKEKVMSLMNLSGSLGECSITSKLDPRWNQSWSDIPCGGLQMPSVCRDMIEKLKKIFGEIPQDLEWRYEKY